MSLTLADYTDHETVRGLLGVAEEEIPDDILDTLGAGHLLEVTFELEDINPTVPTLFEQYRDIAVATRTAAQARFYSVARLYAAYLVADSLMGALSMFSPVTVQDGKAAMQQRQDDPYTALRAAVKGALATWRKRLIDTLAVIDQTIPTTQAPKLIVIGSAGLPSDPVTGA